MIEELQAWRHGDSVLLVDQNGRSVAQMLLGQHFSADDAHEDAKEIARRFNENKGGRSE